MDGRLRHLIDCVETSRATITRPEHAYHAVEVMLAAQAAGRDGMARENHERFSRSRLRRGDGIGAEDPTGARPS